MFNSNPLVEARLKKVEALKELGIDPYPVAAFNPTHSVQQILKAASSLISNQEDVRIAGRVIARRDMGKTTFLDVQDEGHKVQTYFRQSDLDEQTWRALELIDLGDFVGSTGHLFQTRSGDLTVACKSLIILCKASHPIPF